MEEKKEIKLMSAEEAYFIATHSVYLFKLAAKMIQEAANRNEDQIVFDVYDKNFVVVAALKQKLEDQGYEVGYLTEEDPSGVKEPRVDMDILVIRWKKWVSNNY